MNKQKGFYILSLILLGILLLYIFFQITSIPRSSLSLSSHQQFLEIGEDIFVQFTIYNTENEDRNYIFAIFFNDKRMLNDTVLVKAGDRSEFGGHFIAKEPGEVEVTVELYDTGKEELLDRVSYYVTVEPR